MLGMTSPRTLFWKVSEAGERSESVERLQLLAPAEDHDAVIALLYRSHFRAVTLEPWSQAPDAINWYGVDDVDGSLLIICLQRRLVLGSATSGWLSIEGINKLSSATEIRLRATSVALALCEKTLRGERRSTLGAPLEPSDALPSSEFLLESFALLFGADLAKALHDAAVEADAVNLRRMLLTLAASRSTVERIRDYTRRVRCQLAAFNRRGPRLPLLARRDHTGPALVMAIIGSDGSGKSSVSRWLAEILDTAFDARFLYFGTGDGPGSPIRRALNALKRRSRFGTAPTVPENNGSKDVPQNAADSAPTVLRLIWATVVGWERAGKMRALGRARRAGFVVVTDRYPQNEQMGIHDGPRLNHLYSTHTGGLAGVFARVEHSLYAWFAQQIPVRVLLLDVPFELACQRRPEESEAELTRRIAVARTLRFGDAPRIVIDAAQPLAVVKARALRAALEALSADSAYPVSICAPVPVTPHRADDREPSRSTLT